jgi:transposase-like protein
MDIYVYNYSQIKMSVYCYCPRSDVDISFFLFFLYFFFVFFVVMPRLRSTLPLQEPPSSLRTTPSRLERLTKEERLEKATIDYLNDKGTIREVAKAWGVSRSTLHYYVSSNRGEGRLLLSEEEEEAKLVEEIVAAQDNNKPMTKREILDEVKHIVNNREQGAKRTKVPSQQWWRSFRNRNDIKLRTPKKLEPAREKAEKTVDLEA